jgi:lipooligosaccharide transport system permease protein
MFLFSGTFFPIEALPRGVQIVSWAILPLSHIVRINRALVLGRLQPSMFLNGVWIIVVGAIAFLVAIRLMKRRLIN